MMSNYEKGVEEMRKLAAVVAERPYLADVVGSTVYGVAKCGKRRLSTNEKWCIDQIKLEEEEVIPASVVLFLKKKKNIPKFIDMVRVEIWKKLKTDKRLEAGAIIQYSVFFNIHDMKNIEFKNTNLTKLLLVVAIDNEDVFEDTSKIPPEFIDKLHEELEMAPNTEGRMLKASAKIYEILKDRLVDET